MSGRVAGREGTGIGGMELSYLDNVASGCQGHACTKFSGERSRPIQLDMCNVAFQQALGGGLGLDVEGSRAEGAEW